MKHKPENISKLNTWRIRCGEIFSAENLKVLIKINLIVTAVTFSLSGGFWSSNNWYWHLLYNFISSFAIGTCIYFFMAFSNVMGSRKFIQRYLVLPGLLVLAGWIGTLFSYGVTGLIIDDFYIHNSLHMHLKYSTIGVLIIGGTIIAYFIVREKWENTVKTIADMKVKEQKLTQLKTKAELDALQAKVNPHFLFNTLNSIASLIPVDPVKAEEMVQRLAELFRYNLDAGSHELIDLKEEMNIVKKYLEIEKVRLGDRLDYNIILDKNLEEMKVPAHLIQPLVENSVKHGISSTKKGGKITVESVKANGSCHITVTDTGTGLGNANTSGGFGLSGVKERLALHYKENHRFSITSENGVIINIEIPIDLPETES